MTAPAIPPRWSTAPERSYQTQSVQVTLHLHDSRPHVTGPRHGCEAASVELAAGLVVRADDPNELDLMARVFANAASLIRSWRAQQYAGVTPKAGWEA